MKDRLFIGFIILGMTIFIISIINTADAKNSDLFINYLSQIIYTDCKGKDIHINKPIITDTQTNQSVTILPVESYDLNTIKEIIGLFGNINFNNIEGTCQGGIRITAQGLVDGCNILSCEGNSLDIVQYTYFWNRTRVDIPVEEFKNTYVNNSVSTTGPFSPAILGNGNTINQNSNTVNQNAIIETQNKQIANLTDQVIGLKNAEHENSTWKNIGVAFGIIGSIATTISTIYGIKKKREVSHLKDKTEIAKAQSYRAKSKAEKARQVEHTTGAVKNFLDWFKK